MRGDRHKGPSGHRSERLAQQIREEVSQIVDFEMKDERIGFTTVTDVELTPDLSMARVFVSVTGTSEERRESLAALNSAAGFVRTQLAPRIRVKRAPTISFLLDETLERGNRIEDLLKEDEQ